MADYYPLLARALEALPDRSAALRKAVYDRARNALLGQLRSLEPPLPEADIDAERQALDRAIVRLEAEYGTSPPEPVTVAVESTALAHPPAPAQPLPDVERELSLPPATTLQAAAAPALASTRAGEIVSPQVLPEAGPPPALVVARRAGPVGPASATSDDSVAASLSDRIAPGELQVSRRPRLDVKAPRADRSHRMRNLFLGGVLAAVIGLIAAAAILLADKRVDLSENGSDTLSSGRTTPDNKLSDRVGDDRSDAEVRPGDTGSARPDVMVAQRAVLYEENTGDSKSPPVAIQGRATWRLETLSGEQGQPLQSAVRATVEFPDAGLTLTLTLRKNLDGSLPASHTIELAFANSGPGEKRAVQEIGLLQLKDEESARGSPVSGLPVRVRDNLFLIGLSNLPSDVERNTDLLTHRNWFDLAVKYKNGQRGIISFEKGGAGSRVVQSAFDQWRS